MNRFPYKSENELKLLLERKMDFQNFCLAYLNSFGWTVTNISDGEIDAYDALHEKFKILIIFHPHEDFPKSKDLNNSSDNIILMAPEFSPLCQIKGSKFKKVRKHTASGINFTYLTYNDK